MDFVVEVLVILGFKLGLVCLVNVMFDFKVMDRVSVKLSRM